MAKPCQDLIEEQCKSTADECNLPTLYLSEPPFPSDAANCAFFLEEEAFPRYFHAGTWQPETPCASEVVPSGTWQPETPFASEVLPFQAEEVHHSVQPGFGPTPSYAWDRTHQDSAVDSAVEPSAKVDMATPAHVAHEPHSPPQDKHHGVDSPADQPVGTEASSAAGGKVEAMVALAAAVGELRRWQGRCAELRVAQRGVPVEEVERWCGFISEQLRHVAERLEEKLEAQRRNSRRKDETIRLLHHRLQQAQLANCTPDEERHGEPLHRQPASEYIPELEAKEGPEQHSPRIMKTAQATLAALCAAAAKGEDLSAVGPPMPPPPPNPTSAHNRRANSFQVHPRREAAQLKRRDVDLMGQIRSRDQQIEQLTSTMRDLQVVTQKQIGLYRRQLVLKDLELQAKQDEIAQQAAAPAAATGGISGTSFGRRFAAHSRSAQATGSPNTSGTVVTRSPRGAAASTPRPADAERGRGRNTSNVATTATGRSHPRREPRDRSAGPPAPAPVAGQAAPVLSPRAGARDLHLHEAFDREGVMRRRPSPTGCSGAGRRSLSTDKNTSGTCRRRRDPDTTLAKGAAACMRERHGHHAGMRQQR